MAVSEQDIIEELDVEKVSVEEIQVIELLNTFGVSETTIETFLVNSYTVETLRIIQRKEIEELIPPPSLAERTKFIHELDNWRVAQGLPKLVDISSVPATTQGPSASTILQDSKPITRESCTAAFLLNSSSKGQAIINKYNQAPFLSRSDKKSVTHIVVDEFKNRFSKLTSSELLDRAKELKQIFPNEPQETWYQPTFATDSSGKRKRINKQAKGRLYDRNVNYKEVQQCSQQESNEASTSVQSSVDNSSADGKQPD